MGSKKNIETPEKLIELFKEFKEWCKSNPRIENVLLAKTGEIIEVPRERPLTWSRFDSWCNDKEIIHDLEDYRTNRDGRYSDYGGVITRIDREMYSDKYEGAAVGIYNPNIIARDLGLADKNETKVDQKSTINIQMSKGDVDDLDNILGE